jgi:hypothetical protein
MPSNRETIAVVHEAMQSAICVVTTLHAAGCLLGAGRYPRGTGKAAKVEYLVRRVVAWMRLYADHVLTLDKAMELPGESVTAVTEAVVVERVHADPLRFGNYISATAASLGLIAEARLTGDSLLKRVARIIESNTRDIYRPDVLRDHAAKLEAMELGEVWNHYDDIVFEVELHEQSAKSFSAQWQPMALPLEVERLMVGRESKPMGSIPDDQRAYQLKRDNNSMTWPEVTRIVIGHKFDQMSRDAKTRAIARISKAARDYGKRTKNELEKKSPGRPRQKKTN